MPIQEEAGEVEGAKCLKAGLLYADWMSGESLNGPPVLREESLTYVIGGRMEHVAINDFHTCLNYCEALFL